MSKMVTKFMSAQYVNSNTNQLQDLTGILGKEVLSAGEIGSYENSNLSRCAKVEPLKKGPFQFCLPALLGIYRNSKQKEFFRFSEGFLI